MLVLVRNQTCVPGYLERMNIILNLMGNQSSKAFVWHLLEKIRYLLVRCLPFSVCRFFFIGDISDINEKFVEFKKKMAPYLEVIHIPENKRHQLTTYIPPEQLEQKFGGQRPNLVEYWPPTHHTAPGDSIDYEDLGKLRLPPFFIFDEDFEGFCQEHIPTAIVINKGRKPNFAGGVAAGGFKSKPNLLISRASSEGDRNCVRSKINIRQS